MIDSPKGSRVDDFRSREDFESRKHENKKILLPYMIMMATQLPLSLVYLKNLMLTRSHYKLMPAAFIGTAVFLYMRWPRGDSPKFFPSIKSDIFLGLAIFMAVSAAFLVSPWLAFAALLCAAASLLARTNDRHVFGNLLPALAPMVVLLKPPIAFDFDTSYGDHGLLAYLNLLSANLANDILDLAQYAHNFSGNSLELVSQRIDSLQFGNGALSLFTLLIVTGLFIAWQRRPMFRATLLLVTACFWFMTCEAISLAICGISMDTFETDLFSAGEGNRLLQFASLSLAGLLTLLSDRLIAFFFGPVDISAIDEDISYQDMVCRFWNNALAGVVSTIVDVNIKKEVAWAKRRNSMPSLRTQSLLWVLGMGAIALAVMQVQGLISAYASNVSVYSTSASLQLNEATFPPVIADLQFDSHEAGHFEFRTGKDNDDDVVKNAEESLVEEEGNTGDRVKNRRPVTLDTPFHAKRNHWVYQRGGIKYHIVINQAFHSWHNTKADLIDADWQPTDTQSQVEFRTSDELDRVADFAVYRDTLANYRQVYSYQFDGFGRPYEEPVMWTNLSKFVGRGFSALGWRSHPRVLDDRSIEIIVYVDSIGTPAPFIKTNCEQLFLEVTKFAVGRVIDGTLENPAE